MKSELKVVAHSELHGALVVEVTYQGRLICAVYGADGSGVRIVSKHIHSHSVEGDQPSVSVQPASGRLPGVLEVIFKDVMNSRPEDFSWGPG